MARHGSKFVNKHARNTQEQVSMYGVIDDDGIEKEDLTQYYGDMAKRQEAKVLDGVRAVRSYRGTVEDGQDVGKPRRVTTNKTHTGKATGYGGINFKREVAMRKGEEWGDLEIRRRGQNKSRGMPNQSNQQAYAPQPPMMMMVDAPMIPQVYNQEDVRTYSNLSDAYADGEYEEEDEEANEFR
ncbi:hypothetical protein, conserved [Angomonas deanei]|uniref:Uncharacterized protein n=1 Tax=Angomonas deanei TaxID=59799 RepID=A0A7G2CNP1_9TRYP|nr:hypothetical protein, conserved [Angomonas deanei]